MSNPTNNSLEERLEKIMNHHKGLVSSRANEVLYPDVEYVLGTHQTLTRVLRSFIKEVEQKAREEERERIIKILGEIKLGYLKEYADNHFAGRDTLEVLREAHQDIIYEAIAKIKE